MTATAMLRFCLMVRRNGRLPVVLVSLFLLTAGHGFPFEYPMLSRKVQAIEQIIPTGWHILGEIAFGDLDRNGSADAALVLEWSEPVEHRVMLRLPGTDEPERNDTGGKPRLLVVLLAADGGYEVSLVNSDVVFRSDMGGVMGDPFQEVAIERGSVVLYEYGGSRLRWGETDRYRLERQGWRLIGSTSMTRDAATGESEEIDRNYLTGKIKTTRSPPPDEATGSRVFWSDIPADKRLILLPVNVAVFD